MTDLTNYGFGINPNDLSMTNKEVEASGTRMISKLVMQATRLLMSLLNGLRLLMEHWEVKTTCGGVHNYLGMKLD